jgi:hypothetical protein
MLLARAKWQVVRRQGRLPRRVAVNRKRNRANRMWNVGQPDHQQQRSSTWTSFMRRKFKEPPIARSSSRLGTERIQRALEETRLKAIKEAEQGPRKTIDKIAERASVTKGPYTRQ